MDYEKKYRDLVEAVKELQKANPHDEGIQKWIEDNIPEIKESKDERIRQRIIHALHGDVLEISEIKEATDWLEKQGEQKPAEVEPKFHNGDWIIFNGLTLYIKEIVKGYYRTISKGGITNSYDWGIDNAARLWTIQDAKPGDVLSTDDNRPFIFKGRLEEGHPNSPVAYCGIEIENSFLIAEGVSWWTCRNVYPATKEEQDILFAKMKEAGYEWDADKKELKKIDSKPSFDVEIPFGAKDSELEEVSYSIPNGFHAEVIGDKVVIKKGEQKSWSEEDEYRKRQIIRVFKNSGCSQTLIDKIEKWIEKRLKKSQTTWKPSDEHIHGLIWAINRMPDIEKANEAEAVLRDLLEQLNKLK